MDPLHTGGLTATGSFRCADCGYLMTLSHQDALPGCPGCDGHRFERASLFVTDPDLAAAAIPAPTPDPAREFVLREAAPRMGPPGHYLVFGDAGLSRIEVVILAREWTRIGRSLAADVRFDDPTVSRRHALIVRQPDGMRILDDRSLNGVFVNGERVEWRTLVHGDELAVGCHRLHYVDSAAPARRLPPDGSDDRGALAEGRYGQDDDRAASDCRVS
ncbi:unannotated protein [freshwater metagenome]|uniref:Unannotated protein n=1 Tax=freshwater metagenome TaxID=449393 RepID=A0A6J7DSZ5_9ZZZZ|nr:FHA domain-containing protein [Actinomycetota bacterium]